MEIDIFKTEDWDDLTIDEVLRQLIKESDLIEVVCCLDMICNEENKRLLMIKKSYPNLVGQFYPVLS